MPLVENQSKINTIRQANTRHFFYLSWGTSLRWVALIWSSPPSGLMFSSYHTSRVGRGIWCFFFLVNIRCNSYRKRPEFSRVVQPGRDLRRNTRSRSSAKRDSFASQTPTTRRVEIKPKIPETARNVIKRFARRSLYESRSGVIARPRVFAANRIVFRPITPPPPSPCHLFRRVGRDERFLGDRT